MGNTLTRGARRDLVDIANGKPWRSIRNESLFQLLAAGYLAYVPSENTYRIRDAAIIEAERLRHARG